MKITNDMISYELETLNLTIKKGKYIVRKNYQGYQLAYQLENSTAEINIICGISKKELYNIIYSYNWIENLKKKYNNE